MKLKRIVSSLLSAALLTGLLVCPASAAVVSGFTDITDETTAEAAEILRALDVVDGVGGGLFQPNRPLTRAEFCKMALTIMGRGGEAARQSSRVIFSDVKADHWARGYINAAASKPSESEPPLVAGVGNGQFLPEEHITYGAAVAILLRALGYSDHDVGIGLNWYDGYVGMAESVGLSEGLSLAGGDAVTRGQAAILFRNLLFTDLKDSDSPYFTKLGATEEASSIILSVDAVANDGSAGAVKTQNGIYRTDRAPFPVSYEGTRGKVVLDKNGKVLAIRLDETGSDKSISAAEFQSSYVIASGGEKLSVNDAGKVTVYSADKDPVSYEDAWIDLRPGTQLTFHYSPAGKLEYIYLRSSLDENSMVATGTGTAQFSPLIPSGAKYTIYKNGMPATSADIRPYDVATFDKAANVLHISDLKLTGVYENVYPNTVTPTQVTIMGHRFEILPGAINDLSGFKLGETVTLLLTLDGRVAGAVPPNKARSTIVGVVQGDSTPDNLQVKAVNLQGYTFSGKSSLSSQRLTELKGQLVTVSFGSSDSISVSRLTSSGATAPWDVQAGTIGSIQVAENVKIFEKVGNSTIFEVDLEDVTCATVPASKLLYVGKDYAGRANLLILENVTGDAFTYGFLTAGETQTDTDWNGNPIYNPTVTVKTKDDPLGNTTLIGSTSNVKYNTPGGVVTSLDTLNGMSKLAGYVVLESVKDVPRSAFSTDGDQVTVTFQGTSYPVADNVVCYNAAAGKWFNSLAEARAFSDSLTLYYDKAPRDGGKIRLVVAE